MNIHNSCLFPIITCHIDITMVFQSKKLQIVKIQANSSMNLNFSLHQLISWTALEVFGIYWFRKESSTADVSFRFPYSGEEAISE